MTTNRYFLEQLPEPYRSTALKRAVKDRTIDEPAKDMAEALTGSFSWGAEGDMWYNLLIELCPEQEIEKQ